jgi:hypothetical protein
VSMCTVLIMTTAHNIIRANLTRLHGCLRDVSHHILLTMRESTIPIRTLASFEVVTNGSLLEFRKWSKLLLRVSE